MRFFCFIKGLLSDFLYKLELGKKQTLLTDTPAQETWDIPYAPQPEFSWVDSDSVLDTMDPLDVPTLLLKEGEQWVLIIEYDFLDIPSWLEWDQKIRKLSVVQMGGKSSPLILDPDALARVFVDRVRRMLLVTGAHKERISHFISVITRD